MQDFQNFPNNVNFFDGIRSQNSQRQDTAYSMERSIRQPIKTAGKDAV
jgi:hypothetical protein